MRYMAKKRYTSLVLVLSVMLCVMACSQGDLSDKAGADEEVTIKLQVGSRAPGAEDAWMRDDDDRFSSLAVYVFDEGGRFLALHQKELEESKNTETVAFNTSSSAHSLYAVANYAAYKDLDLSKPMTKDNVKALVANSAGNVTLESSNILMVGEVDVQPFTANGVNETKDVTLELHRLAARVDVFAFKEPGWDADVQVTKVEFSGGVKNTTLNYVENVVELPKTLVFTDKEEFMPGETNLPLEFFEGDNAILFQQEKHLRGRFYTYRTKQEQASIDVPRLAITVKVNNNNEKTYTAILTDKNVAADAPVTLDAGNVYQICAVLTKAGLVIDMQVADWESEEDYELDFQYPTYENPMLPFDNSPGMQLPYEQPTVYYNHDENSLEGSCRFSFKLTKPVNQGWRATLLDATEEDFTVDVYQDGKKIDNPTASDQPFEIRVRALKPENVNKTVTLVIAFTPVWDPGNSSLLMINGNPANPAWGGSDDPARIVIKQENPPVETK